MKKIWKQCGSIAAVVLLFLVVTVTNTIFPDSAENESLSAESTFVEIPQTQEPESANAALPDETDEISDNTQQDASNETQLRAEAVSETFSETPEENAYEFRKPRYLTEHFEKHGAEFSYRTQEEYLAGANKVIQNPEALHKLEAEDGDDVYYVESTGEFVVVSTDGYIRTYFRADFDYYNRQ